MSMKPSHALLAALAMIAAPAFAQEAADPATQEPAADAAPAEAQPEAAEAPAAETEQAPAADQAETASEAAAEAADPGPKAGEYYARTTHQDWTIRCIKSDRDTDPCELYQLMKDGDGNSVAELTMIPLKNGDVAAGATLVAPLETDLIKGLGFVVDSGKARGYPFSFCAPVGCVSRMGFTEAELTQLKRGGKATVSLLPFGADPEKPVELNLSLSGFTAAFDELSELAATVSQDGN
ncbi:Invasion protein IalB, involved in pathogenesis [Paracoccus homiensis]|uniref:Invasion protein IalB, involved in pathogenesis n=2 Tax=Paracoccus homiensis TaxID=364199 RepID=A0A1I0H0L8_9RHOB|nr:Invasion protein IalB, involved in pathogenesis [Paracoccus homiensis]